MEPRFLTPLKGGPHLDGPWQDPKRAVNPPQIDSEFIFKIIRRNWQNAGLVFFVTLALGVTLSFFVKNSYRSKVVASFSRTDSAVMSLEAHIEQVPALEI
jgi:hypothetical protein